MKLLLFCVFAVSSFFASAQKHPIEKTWYNAEKTSKIRVFKATDGKYYGKIVWLKVPNDDKGNPRTDKKNADEKNKTKPLMDLLILSGFSATKDPNILEGGKVYDPNNGKTYCGKLTIKDGIIDLRGYICGLSWLGRNSQWTLAE